ncbi:CtnG [Drepanopeziza brunnea f. sp. 'multigermtubi' MB_m1]|uniref:CtnG n=1 Tax=Marssonina brunnea f. sp. multigermtubi (strain MB_m1) TaxID=1072389 RepID=K1WG86_MARBU|nr:CtnG [Drepanopeziza brunnea f. sp. 'multigermtubi' MB_m1]EKD11871.1 CtnG [Drepanopeziza brunnea f. sp. 'multigermtubi' MB_m1]
MAFKTVSTLKFVGSISLGLLTGFSYSLSTLTLPTFSTLPSATSASKAFSNLAYVSLSQLRALAAISSSSFLFAYLLSPRSQKHPYLLWTSLFVGASGFTEYALQSYRPKSATSTGSVKTKVKKSKGRQMDASYEVLGASDRDSEGTVSGEETDESVNGEEVRQAMEGFMVTQIARTVVAGMAFAMSTVGIWGDGAADIFVIEM